MSISPGERRWQLDLSDEKGLGYQSQVIFGNSGYSLKYNEGFRREQNRSYSVALRPDFTLHGPNSLRLVFDAKFRFDTNVFMTPHDEADFLDDSSNTQRVAKQADLYKMHTYRDALCAQAAITLYPGDQDVFHHTNATVTEVEWTALVSGQWAGIGAVVMKPVS